MGLYDNLIAYYKFEGNLADETGNHPATDTYNSVSYIQGARDFAAQTGLFFQMQNGITPGTFDNGFSFLGWVNYNTSTGIDRHVFAIVYDPYDSSNYIALRKLDVGTLTYALTIQGVTLYIPNAIELDIFQHIAIICTPAGTNYDVKFYVNGEQKQTFDSISGQLRSTVPKLASYIGFNYNFLGRHPKNGSIAFNGALDDIKFYNMPKSYSDVMLDYKGSIQFNPVQLCKKPTKEGIPVLPTPLYNTINALQPDPYQYQMKWIYFPNSPSTTAYLTSTHPFRVDIIQNAQGRWQMIVYNYNQFSEDELIGIRRYGTNKSILEDSTTNAATNIFVTNLETVKPAILESTFDIYDLSGITLMNEGNVKIIQNPVFLYDLEFPPIDDLLIEEYTYQLKIKSTTMTDEWIYASSHPFRVQLLTDSINIYNYNNHAEEVVGVGVRIYHRDSPTSSWTQLQNYYNYEVTVFSLSDAILDKASFKLLDTNGNVALYKYKQLKPVILLAKGD